MAHWLPEEQQRLEAVALGVLAKHVGEGNPISMSELHSLIFGEEPRHHPNDSRNTRMLVQSLRFQGRWICSSYDKRNPGYYLAASKEEFMEFIKSFRERHLQGLGQIAGMLNLGLPKYLGQLSLELAEL